jgi:hypothetical protein
VSVEWFNNWIDYAEEKSVVHPGPINNPM